MIYVIAFLEGIVTLGMELYAVRVSSGIVGLSVGFTGILLGTILVALSLGYWYGGRSARREGTAEDVMGGARWTAMPWRWSATNR